MKSERLLAMLLLLQAKGRLSARELSGSLEVSERTIYRDIDSLSAAGIPVYAERGSRGGIVLADGYRKALTQFREDEIRALFVASSDTLADVGLGDNLHRALEKLAGALPESQRRAAEHTRRLIHLDSRRWKQASQPREILGSLRRASAEDRRVLLHYRDRNGKITERITDPLGLVAKAGVWYLVARYGTEMRVFRADRILSLDVRSEGFARPAGFKLDAFWRTWSAEFERNLPGYRATLSVAPRAVENVTAYWESEILAATHNGGRGWKTVSLLFPSREVALAHVVMWGDRVDVVEPIALRSAVLKCARHIVKRYATSRRRPHP